ncbi:uncharacterized protein LDX57_012504 [Aspergillus melleus]|uniref:uncharacterized protein n=1 Tax=Aspergillus melleus TaxID=138277 RepID=UPI001E8CCE32|nr:uncharacterized protein LDX57_012504 [Aspergillus melleus]KAH8434873.1 hypothetical protein LDX57_012504 [Aspergillus melleus]
MPCAVPCDIIPCDKRCDERLGCGHRCPSLCGEKCPDQKFCQTCGNTDALERKVDLITFDKYREINLDEDPCVFLPCGHFYAVSSLDGIMEIKKFYNVDPATDTIISPKWTQREMIGDSKLRGCPECRLPLRDIPRYNRIVKKAILDQSTRRFIIKANSTYQTLVSAVSRREVELENTSSEFLLQCATVAEQLGNLNVYKPTISIKKEDELQTRIQKFIDVTAASEQPYGKVKALLASSASRTDTVKSHIFQIEESKIQTGFQICGQLLHLRLTWAILWNYKVIFTNVYVDPNLRSKICDAAETPAQQLIDFSQSVRHSSSAAKLLAHEVEAMIYYALFSLLSLTISETKGQTSSTDATHDLNEQASTILQECETLRSNNPGVLGFLKGDIDKAKGLLKGATFYSFVTTEEKKQVYLAMATQLPGIGHWYYCRNYHPANVDCQRKKLGVRNAERPLEDLEMFILRGSPMRWIMSSLVIIHFLSFSHCTGKTWL